MTNSGFSLGTIFGIKLRVDFSWLLIFAFFTYILAEQVFAPIGNLDLPRFGYWIMALITVSLFFATVVVHELAHSFVAKAKKIPVKSISLFIFGGAAEMAREPQKAADESAISLAGPASSMVLGGIFLFLGHVVFANISLEVAYICAWLGRINVFLALFNLIPAFPLDGGRVLRAIVWSVSKDYYKSTKVASIVGRVGGVALIVGGLWWAFVGQDYLAGIWLSIIGWFLYSAASASVSQLDMRILLRNHTVAQAQRRHPALRADLPLNLASESLRTGNSSASLVEDLQALAITILNADDYKKYSETLLRQKTVGQVAKSAKLELAVNPTLDLMSAVEKMNENDVTVLPVIDEMGRPIDALHIEDLVRYLNIVAPRGARR